MIPSDENFVKETIEEAPKKELIMDESAGMPYTYRPERDHDYTTPYTEEHKGIITVFLNPPSIKIEKRIQISSTQTESTNAKQRKERLKLDAEEEETVTNPKSSVINSEEPPTKNKNL